MNTPLTIQTGRHVEIELVDLHGEVERLSFDIVPDKQADFTSGFLGESTPLARAILGAAAGSEVPYRLDEVVKIRILSVERAASSPSSDAAARREAALRKAEAEIHRRDAINFASSFNSKWGAYDPEGVEKWEEDE